MLHTFAARRPYSITHMLWLIAARLVQVLVVCLILALLAGIGVVVYLAMTVGGQL